MSSMKMALLFPLRFKSKKLKLEDFKGFSVALTSVFAATRQNLPSDYKKYISATLKPLEVFDSSHRSGLQSMFRSITAEACELEIVNPATEEAGWHLESEETSSSKKSTVTGLFSASRRVAFLVVPLSE